MMPELTAELIVEMRVPTGVRLSPDGAQVAFVVGRRGKREEHEQRAIWLAPTDRSTPARQITTGSAHDHHPRWAPDGSVLYFLSDRETHGCNQIYRLPMVTGEPERLTEWRESIATFAITPDGRTVAFTAKDEPTDEDERRKRERDDADVFGERWPFARLCLLDVETREVRTVDQIGDRHVVSVTPSADGRQIAVVTWPTPEINNLALDNRIFLVDPATGDARVLCDVASGARELVWCEADRTILYRSSTDPGLVSGTAIFAIDVADGTVRRLTEGSASCPEVLAGGGAGPVFTVLADGLDSVIARVDPTTGALSAGTSLAADLCGSLSASADGSMLAGVVSTSDRPVEVWAVAPDEPVVPLTDLNPELHEITWGTQARVSWTASDGLALEGLVVYPPGKTRADGPFPLVLAVHGGPYSRYADGFQLGMPMSGQWLAAAGFAVFLPNARGSSGRGHAFAKTVRGAVGREDYDDLIAGVDSLVAAGIADPNRLGIGGASQGGFMAAWAVGQTDRFKAAVMIAGVSDWGMMVAESDMPHFEAEASAFTGWNGPGPHRHAELSPISYAHRMTTPLLILHGADDKRVPVSQARYLAQALRAGNVAHELVVYPREPHSFGERAHLLDAFRRTREWFTTWGGRSG